MVDIVSIGTVTLTCQYVAHDHFKRKGFRKYLKYSDDCNLKGSCSVVSWHVVDKTWEEERDQHHQ